MYFPSSSFDRVSIWSRDLGARWAIIGPVERFHGVEPAEDSLGDANLKGLKADGGDGPSKGVGPCIAITPARSLLSKLAPHHHKDEATAAPHISRNIAKVSAILVVEYPPSTLLSVAAIATKISSTHSIALYPCPNGSRYYKGAGAAAKIVHTAIARGSSGRNGLSAIMKDWKARYRQKYEYRGL